MKKQTLLPVLFLLSFFVFTLNKAKAHSGDSCSHPISLTNGVNDSIPLNDSIVWFSFTATANSQTTIIYNPQDTLPGRINRLVLYSGSCALLDSLAGGTFDIGIESPIVFHTTGLTPGTVYIIKAIADRHNNSRHFNIAFFLQGTTNNCPAHSIGCNVVTNGNFETMNVTCPVHPGNIMGNTTDVSCWYNPDAATTPDYFNSCNSPYCSICIPENLAGCATPHSGDGMAGIYAYITEKLGNCYKEYIQQTLAAPLVAGVTYNVSYWVQVANDLPEEVDSKSMGLFISIASPNVVDNTCTLEDPDNIYGPTPIVLPDPRIITAATNCSPSFNTSTTWVNITGTYTAIGGEQSITIGNFNTADYTQANTSTPCLPNIYYQPYNGAYYYIDDVSIEPDLKLTITPSSTTICAGNSTHLSATTSGGSSPYTYVWMPGSLSGSSVTVSPGTTTVYTATVRDINGCSATATATVTVNPTPPAPQIFGPLFACGSQPFTYFVQPPAAGASYSWTCSHGSPSSGSGTTAVITTFTSTPATITFTATYSVSPGCPSSSTYTVYPCCADSTKYSVYINGPVTISSPTSYTGQTILINGAVTINANVDIHNCDIQFTPNSSITINNGHTLSLEGGGAQGCTHLYASPSCNAMWNGITIEPGGTLAADVYVLIEDAKQAVVAVNTASLQGTFKMNYVVFNKNYQDIVVSNSSLLTYTGHADYCIFTSRDLSPYFSACSWYTNWNSSSPTTALLPPYSSNTRTSMGIDATYMTWSNFQYCYFDNIDYGVYAYYSNLGVYNNTFQNIQTTFGANVAIRSFDVYSASTTYSLTVGDMGDPNNFTNCNIGVEAAYLGYVQIENNTFDNKGYFPFLYAIDQGNNHSTPLPHTINIQENTIYNAQTAIRSFQNNKGNVVINYNNISGHYCNGYNYTGISAFESLTGTTDVYNIEENTMDVQTVGINASLLNGAIIDYNPIDLGVGLPNCMGPLYYNGYGIEATSCQSTEIGCNTIQAVPPLVSSNTYTGIYLSASQSTIMENNDITYPYTDIQYGALPFTGDNTWFNTLNNANTGIYSSVSSTITFGASGDPTDNQFTAMASDNVCVYTGSTYYYDLYNPIPTSCPVLHNTSTSPDRTHACQTAPSQPHAPTRHQGVLDTNLPVKGDSVVAIRFTFVPDSTTIVEMQNTALNRDSFGNLQDTNSALAKEGVVRMLWANKSLLNSNNILHHFNDSISAASLGEILAIDTSIISATSQTNYPGLLATLNAIVPANNIEANLQTTAAAQLSLRINDSLSANQRYTLWVLANKCPYWDGNAVYEARAMLAYIDSADAQYSDSCYSRNAHKFEKRSGSNTLNALFNLYPNPNNGGFILSYQLQKGQTGTFTMYTTLGEKVAEYSLDANSTIMNINQSSLANGVYLYSIKVNNNVVKQDKVVIMK